MLEIERERVWIVELNCSVVDGEEWVWSHILKVKAGVMVISCQELSGPACLCNGGSAGPQSFRSSVAEFSSTQRMQPLKGGPARAKRAPHPTHTHTLNVSLPSSQWLPQTTQLVAGNPDGKVFKNIVIQWSLFSSWTRGHQATHLGLWPRLTFFFRAAAVHKSSDCGRFLFREHL